MLKEKNERGIKNALAWRIVWWNLNRKIRISTTRSARKPGNHLSCERSPRSQAPSRNPPGCLVKENSVIRIPLPNRYSIFPYPATPSSFIRLLPPKGAVSGRPGFTCILYFWLWWLHQDECDEKADDGEDKHPGKHSQVVPGRGPDEPGKLRTCL